MKLITASSIPTASMCMRAAAARAFGARGRMESMIKDMLPDYLTEYRPTGIKAVIGTACHKGAEIVLKEKIQGIKTPLSVMRDATHESLKEQKDVSYDRETPDKSRAERTALAMATLWHEVVPARIDPVDTEIRFSANLGNDWVLSGQLDVIERDHTAVEHKFGSGVKRSYLSQIGAQGILLSAHGRESEIIKISSVARKLNPTIQDVGEEVFKTTMAKDMAKMWIKKIIEQSEKYLVSGNPEEFTASVGCHICSKEYCRAFGTDFCKYTKA